MKNKEFVVSRPDQVRALASPVRNQIHLHMELCGKCTVNELARRMGCSAESLYYHLRLMERVGLVVDDGRRLDGPKPETVYRLAGDRIRIDPDKSDRRFLDALSQGIRTLLRHAERCMQRALNDPLTFRSGKRRNLRIEQQIVRLNQNEMKTLQDKIDDINHYLTQRRDRAKERMYVITIAISTANVAD